MIATTLEVKKIIVGGSSLFLILNPKLFTLVESFQFRILIGLLFYRYIFIEKNQKVKCLWRQWNYLSVSTLG